jgi:hypothetical protein
MSSLGPRLKPNSGSSLVKGYCAIEGKKCRNERASACHSLGPVMNPSLGLS